LNWPEELSSTRPSVLTDEMLQAWYRVFLVQRLGAVPEGCTSKTAFADLGLDSMDAVVMAGHLGDAFGWSVEPEVFLTHTCLDEVIDTMSQDGRLVFANRTLR